MSYVADDEVVEMTKTGGIAGVYEEGNFHYTDMTRDDRNNFNAALKEGHQRPHGRDMFTYTVSYQGKEASNDQGTLEHLWKHYVDHEYEE